MGRTVVRESGLYQNGRLWWVRSVRSPMTGLVKARSTGSDDLRVANRTAQMLDDFRQNRIQWDWLDMAARGAVELDALYNHYAAGTLHLLRDQLGAASRAANDPSLAPFVEQWAEHLKTVGIVEKTRLEYVRQVRLIVGDSKRSGFNEDAIKTVVHSQPVSSSTKRRIVAALRLFYRWAKKRVPLADNPFEDADWIPSNNPPRSVFWDHDQRLTVLSKMNGLERVAMTVALGSGIESGALLAMRGGDVGSGNERIITAHGTKNEHRMARTIFVDEWAWKALREHARSVLPNAPLWPWSDGKHLREAFYEAQVSAGLIAEPAVNKKSGKKLWGAVKPHTVHDARHSYVLNRLLGLDGEPRQDLKFCAHQLGHADEQMVLKVYGKANIAARLRLFELREARERKTA